MFQFLHSLVECFYRMLLALQTAAIKYCLLILPLTIYFSSLLSVACILLSSKSSSLRVYFAGIL